MSKRTPIKLASREFDKPGSKILFSDRPDFTPNLTPSELFSLGSFGGGYFRQIHSTVTDKTYRDQWKEFPESWWKDIDPKVKLTSETYNTKTNKYRVNCGVKADKNDKFGLDYWEKSNWITAQDPYGWVQWYCRFFNGRRSEDDSRQISRWAGVAGLKGRFRNNLIGKCVKGSSGFDDFSVSPVVRQTLQHWAYQLTEEDFDFFCDEKKRKIVVEDDPVGKKKRRMNSLPTWPLEFNITSKCSKTKARAATLSLPNYNCKTPMFMPVATQAIMKGVSTSQLIQLDCHLILSNTYHLALIPALERLKKYNGARQFMNWPRAMLTDSGGFQMVSLAKLMEVDETGVKFSSHLDGKEMFLSPEGSIEIQNAIGADIMMQLDDVVSTLTTGPRVEEAMWRSIRWLDRCLKYHFDNLKLGDDDLDSSTNEKRSHLQNLFPIIQGGLDPNLRKICCEEMIKRDCPGYAIGGLSGGESKDQFWRVVSLCTDILPKDKPIYCMGVGYAEDLVVCAALGVDMFDCVFPTRTARFGNALTRNGALNLKKSVFGSSESPIDKDCSCETCKTTTRSELHTLFQVENTAGCQLVTIHNIAFQMRLMNDIKKSISEDKFTEFVQTFMYRFYKQRVSRLEGGNRFGGVESSKDIGKEFSDSGYPIWIVNSLESVGITLI